MILPQQVPLDARSFVVSVLLITTSAPNPPAPDAFCSPTHFAFLKLTPPCPRIAAEWIHCTRSCEGEMATFERVPGEPRINLSRYVLPPSHIALQMGFRGHCRANDTCPRSVPQSPETRTVYDRLGYSPCNPESASYLVALFAVWR